MTEERVRQFPAGKLLFEEGDASYYAYLVKEGAVELSVRVGSEKKVLYIMKKGQVFGEMGIISDDVRSATAICLEPCTLSIISRDMIEKKMRNADPYLKYVIEFLIDRVKTLSRS